MIELPLVFLGGLLGSAHCVGMCGGFAVSIGHRLARVRLEPLPTTALHGRADLHLFVFRNRRRLRAGSGSPAEQASGSTSKPRSRWWRESCSPARASGPGHGAAAILAEARGRRIGLPGGNVRRAIPRLARARRTSSSPEC